MKKLLFLLVAGIILFPLASYAQQDNTDQKEEMMVVPKSVLTPAQVQQVETQTMLETYGEYAGLGKEIGIAVNEGLAAVTDQTARFAQTSVGKFTMFIIGWKVLGGDFLQLIVGVPIWIFGSIFFVFSYYRNCIPRRVLVEKGEKERKYQLQTPHENSATGEWDTDNWAIAHGVAYVIFFIMCALITLG